MAHILTAEVILQAAVANAGTFTMPYPRGYTSASVWSGTGHVLVDQAGNLYTSGFTVAFGTVITVTNVSMGTLAAGRAFRLQTALADTTTPAVFAYDSAGNATGLTTPRGEVVALGVKGYTPRVQNYTGFNKKFTQFIPTDGGAFLQTAFVKEEAEAPFSGVRIWTAGFLATVTGPWKMVIASTETMATDTLSHAYVPLVGGVSYDNVLSAPFASQAAVFFGHRPVTWNGNATCDFLSHPGGGSNGTSNWDMRWKVSDWIPLKSVPRADGGTRPAVMWRMYNSAGNRQSWNLATTYDLVEMSKTRYRPIQALNVAGDSIATPATHPAAVPVPGTTNAMVNIAFLEFLYDVPVRSVYNLGNSRQDSWPREIQKYSTPAVPITWFEHGCPGNDMEQFFNAYDQIVGMGFTGATDIILQGYDINEVNKTRKNAEDKISWYMFYIRKFREAGMRVWLTTDYAPDNNTTEKELERQRILAWIRSICASGMCTLVETDLAGLTDYTTTPPSLAAIYDVGDGQHANQAGEDVMSNVMAAAWLANP